MNTIRNVGRLSLLGAVLVACGFRLNDSHKELNRADVDELVRQNRDSQAALVRGDVDGFLAEIVPAKDFTLMAPFGGPPRHGFDFSQKYREEIKRFFKSGTFEQEVVATYASGDFVVLATIERVHAEVGGLPAQDWARRVTQVFRREGDRWQLIHRHADPLANGISLEQASVLAQ